MRRTFNTPIILGVVVVLVLALLFTGVAMELFGRGAYRVVSRSGDLLVTERTAYGLMLEMQSSVRGFVIAQDERFLAPYNDAQKKLPPLMDEMKLIAAELDQTADGSSPSLLAAVSEMEAKFTTWLGFAEANIDRVRTGRRQEAIADIDSGRGLALYTDLREINERVAGLMTERQAQAASNLNTARQLEMWLLVGLGIVAAISVVLAMMVSQREGEQQEEARNAAEAERERLLTIIENLPVAVRLVDGNTGNVVLQNVRASASLTQEEWNSVPLEEHGTHFNLFGLDGAPLTPEDSPVLRALRRGETVTDYELRWRFPGMEQRDLLMSAGPLRNARGKVTSAVVVIQDVTAMRQSDRRKDEFIATAAHEIRNPLAALSGYQQLLRRVVARTEAPPNVTQLIGSMEKQISRLNGLVERLLDAQRVELGKLVLHRAVCDLRQVVHMAVEDARLADEGAHIIEAKTPDEAIMGDWDGTRVEQVISNFLNNACRYTPQGSRVEVHVGQTRTCARVEVVDEGPGVPLERRERLFHRYYQSEVDTTGHLSSETGEAAVPRRRGLGLGLYISREIIEAHSGKIGVEPNPEGGSIFWFTLPA